MCPVGSGWVCDAKDPDGRAMPRDRASECELAASAAPRFRQKRGKSIRQLGGSRGIDVGCVLETREMRGGSA